MRLPAARREIRLLQHNPPSSMGHIQFLIAFPPGEVQIFSSVGMEQGYEIEIYSKNKFVWSRFGIGVPA